MTEKEKNMYQDGIDAGSACNLSGLVYSLARHMETMAEMELGTQEKNTHPVTMAFVYQMYYLAFRQEPDDPENKYHTALNKCYEAVQTVEAVEKTKAE